MVIPPRGLVSPNLTASVEPECSNLVNNQHREHVDWDREQAAIPLWERSSTGSTG
jgi:hypothetical protein